MTTPRAGDSSGTPARGETGPAGSPTAHIRGSWLLVTGRLVNVVLDFGIQVALVRYLTTADYGAFAYGLSVVSLLATVAVLGLDRAAGRFLPIYDEGRETGRVVGTWLFTSVAVMLVGTVLAIVVALASPLLGESMVQDPTALAVLLVLVIMTPLNALAAITRQVLATFASPRLILFRSYLLSPILQCGLVLGVILTGADVLALALGWVAIIAISAGVSTFLVLRILAQRGLLHQLRRQRLDVPFRPLLGFGLPLFGSSLVVQLRLSGAVILLQALHGTSAVALFRAALPVARQTQLLFETFQLLFTPLAARLHARGDRTGLNDAYWQTTLWIAVFSFPVFAVAFAFAEPLIALVFGERYRDMAPALGWMALGFYVNAALGFNALLLRILGRVRFAVAVDVGTTAAGLGIGFPLIAAWGATGAAVAVAGTLVAQNLAYQFGLRQEAGLRAIDGRFLPVYGALLVATVGLWLVGTVMRPPLLVGILLTGLASLGVFVASRRFLRVAEIFPELLRIPLMRLLMGS